MTWILLAAGIAIGVGVWLLTPRRGSPPADRPAAPSADASSPEAPSSVDALRREVARAGLEVGALAEFPAGSSSGILALPVEARRAVAVRDDLRSALAEPGWYPVVVRDEHGSLADPFTKAGAPGREAILEKAASVDVERWTKERVAKDPEYYGDVDVGTWGNEKPARGFTIPFDVVTNEPAREVRLAFVPTRDPWAVCAWFRYGGWNECPPPEVHVAMHRRWWDRHGAEVVCLDGDTIEMRVLRSPRDRVGAEALAHEQFVYSGGDLVYQGMETLRALAGTLIDAETWYFWWD